MAGRFIHSDDWGNMVRGLGEARARRELEARGWSVNDEAQSASDYAGGSAKQMAMPPDFATEGGELPAQNEDQYNDASRSLAALGPDEAARQPQGELPPLAAKSSPSLAAKAGVGDDILENSRKNISDIYEQAAERLKGLYHAPTTGEMLMAMGAAMLKPTYGGFKEALGNAIGVIPNYMQARREYQNDYAKELAALQKGYASDVAGLQGRYITASMAAGKGPQAHASADQLGQRFWTSGPLVGMPVAPPDRIAALMQFKDDPEAVSAFNRTYGVNADKYYISLTQGGE